MSSEHHQSSTVSKDPESMPSPAGLSLGLDQLSDSVAAGCLLPPWRGAPRQHCGEPGLRLCLWEMLSADALALGPTSATALYQAMNPVNSHPSPQADVPA